MPTRAEMQRLVQTHSEIPDEPMETAIWIQTDRLDAWLLEVLPQLPDDARAGEPFSFNPSLNFRYPLHLIAANRTNIERVLRSNPDLADQVAEGQILYGEDVGQQLIDLASQCRNG